MPFRTTDWSVIRKAAASESAPARAALASLCETYWWPVYGFVRRRGHSPSDAEDLTQAYFARFLEKDYIGDVRPEAGRFRSFLCASVSHFLSNERDRERALKRGGGRPPVSLDAALAEERWRLEPVDDLTPEALFERQWVAALLERCLRRLRAEQESEASRRRFEKLKPFLAGGVPESYADLASELGTTAAALRVAVHRLRKRFGALLREEVRRTVAHPSDVDDEIRQLLGGRGAA